jgi:hypothetical protein
MRSRILKHRAKRAAAGGVLVEAVLCIPFIILLVMSAADFYFIFDTYSSLSLSSQEALFGGIGSTGTSGTRNNLNPSLTSYNDCLAAPTQPDCGHTLLHWRGRRLMETYQARFVTGTLGIQSSYVPASRSYELTLSAEYSAFSPWLDGVVLRKKFGNVYAGT